MVYLPVVYLPVVHLPPSQALSFPPESLEPSFLLATSSYPSFSWLWMCGLGCGVIL